MQGKGEEENMGEGEELAVAALIIRVAPSRLALLSLKNTSR